MKKFIALLLCVVTIIGMLAGCSQPKEQPSDVSSLSGTYIRTTNGANMIVVDNYGPIVLSGLNNEFKKVQSGSEIKITTGAIAESYPAQASAETMEVVKVKPLNIYEEKYKTLIEMGWYPTQLLVTRDPDENYIVHNGDIEQTFKHCYNFNEGTEIVVILSNYKDLTYNNYNDIADDMVVLFQYEKKNTTTEETITKPETEYKENYDAIATLIDEIDNGKNVIYSPLSFNIAMGMVANGVTEEVKAKFEDYYGMPVEEYNKFSGYYLSQNDGVTEYANSIWVNKDFALQEKFKEIMKTYFDAECESVEFNQEFVQRLNDWCNEKTKGLIPKILNSPPDKTYRCFLANALYFKGEWEDKYATNEVKDVDFKLINNETINVKGMFSEENIYLENENATGFMKMYKDGKYAFVGILPKEEGDFKFSNLDVESLLNSKSNEPVYTMLPKFKFDNTNDLIDTIDAVGLGDVKSIGSLPNIIQDDNTLSVGLILQKAIIDVNETGTEAGAITIVGTKTNSIIGAKQPPKVYLDRAFAFLIYDVENDVVLFAGKVINPND